LYFTSPPYSNLTGVKCLTYIGTEGGTSGWDKDKITKGMITFILDNENGAVDILYRDVTGINKSVKEDGATTLLRHYSKADGVYQVLVDYGGVIEVYLFKLNNNGTGEVVIANSRASGLFIKANILQAYCKK
jgi:hypothetical protein